MLGGLDADYVNANYIDVSASPLSSLLAGLALPNPGALPGGGAGNLAGNVWGFAPTPCSQHQGAQRRGGQSQAVRKASHRADRWET